MQFLNRDDGVIIADRDADGAVSAAILLYLQGKRAFPLKKKVVVNLFPSGPHSIQKVYRQFAGCPGFLALLDIPYTEEVGEVLRSVREKCKDTLLIYVDHHFSSVERLGEIRGYCDYCIVNERVPTSMHLVRLAERLGFRLPEKLLLYSKAIGYIELGRRPPKEFSRVVEIVASIARALKLERSDDFWKKIVKWLASSLPIPLSKSDSEVLERVEQEIAMRDKELDEAVTDLSITARRVGCFRFVDARKRWRRRGVSSLATRLARKMRSPIALLARLGDEEILVIRTRNKSARIIAAEMEEEGLAMDTAGHSNLAIVKLRKGYDQKKLRDILIKSCRFVE